jgi:hypothetical protein
MFSSTQNLPTINDFESAHEHFTKTPKPVTRKGQWNDNQRPLKDTRSHHYRIEQGRGGEYYDVVLYTTAMARFYAPTPDGRRVMYTAHNSNTSKQFMRNVTRHSTLMHMDTTDNQTVAVPVSYKDSIYEDGHGFSASLWFDNSPHKRLVVEQSAHTPMYTHKVGKSDKETRNHIRALCEPYITLACLRMGDWRRMEYVDEDLLTPFRVGVGVTWAQRDAIRCMTQGNDLEQVSINTFMALAEKVYDYEATKLYYKANYDSEKPVTEKVLADGLWRVIVRETYALQRKSEAVPLPQFMNIMNFPRTTATPFA